MGELLLSYITILMRVQVWCTKDLVPLYIINPYLDTDAGDIFCVTYAPSLQTLYFGCQNTSLQWFDFSTLPSSSNSTASTSNCSPKSLDDLGFLATSLTSRPGSKRHKFFAHGVASGHSTPTPLCGAGVPKPLYGVLQLEAFNVIDSAHVGYIYSMALAPSPLESACEPESDKHTEIILATGSGDETVNVSMEMAKVHNTRSHGIINIFSCGNVLLRDLF